MKFSRSFFIGLTLITISMIGITYDAVESDGLNYWDIRIPAENLKKLNESIATPYFLSLSPQYDHTWIFTKDRMLLAADVWNATLDGRPVTLTQPFLETGRKLQLLDNVVISDYILSRAFVERLLQAPGANYFILTPDYYRNDRQFVSYMITAYDEHDTEVTIPDADARQINPCPPARPPY
jgi:hypothetical protein